MNSVEFSAVLLEGIGSISKRGRGITEKCVTIRHNYQISVMPKAYN